jgi:hypothetical protein
MGILQQQLDHRNKRTLTRNGSSDMSEHDRLEMPDSFDGYKLTSKNSTGAGDSWEYDNGVTSEAPGNRYSRVVVSVTSNRHVTISIFDKHGRQLKSESFNRDYMVDDGPDGVIHNIKTLLSGGTMSIASAPIVVSLSKILATAGVQHLVVADTSYEDYDVTQVLSGAIKATKEGALAWYKTGSVTYVAIGGSCRLRLYSYADSTALTAETLFPESSDNSLQTFEAHSSESEGVKSNLEELYSAVEAVAKPYTDVRSKAPHDLADAIVRVIHGERK